MSNYNELCHYGIPGMKWGVRRFQNANGSYTPTGARRHSLGISGATGSAGGSSRSSGGSGRKGIDKRKLARNIAIGVGTAAAIGGAAYGIHRLKKSGKLDQLAAKGREVLAQRSANANARVAKGLNDSFASGGTKRAGVLAEARRRGQSALSSARNAVKSASANANARVAKGLNDSFASGGTKRAGVLAEARRRGQSALSSAKGAINTARGRNVVSSARDAAKNLYRQHPNAARAVNYAALPAVGAGFMGATVAAQKGQWALEKKLQNRNKKRNTKR